MNDLSTTPHGVTIAAAALSPRARRSFVLMISESLIKNSGNENLRLSVLFFIIVMDSGSLVDDIDVLGKYH